MLEVVDTPELLAPFVANTMEREATLLQMRSIAGLLEETTQLPITHWKMDPIFVLRAQRAGEERLQLPTGEHVLFNTVSKEFPIQFPIDRLNDNFPTQSRIADQSSINMAESHYMLNENYLIVMFWG